MLKIAADLLTNLQTDSFAQQDLAQSDLTDLLSESKSALIEHMMQTSVVEDENVSCRKTLTELELVQIQYYLTIEIDYNCQDRFLLQCSVIYERCIVTNEKTEQIVAEIIQTNFMKQIAQKIHMKIMQTMQMIQVMHAVQMMQRVQTMQTD